MSQIGGLLIIRVTAGIQFEKTSQVPDVIGARHAMCRCIMAEYNLRDHQHNQPPSL